MSAKDILKKIYYKLIPVSFPAHTNFKLGFVFHTEEIFNSSIHNNLIRFCKEYTSITGVKCICVTMTPPNKRVEKGMKTFGCSNDEYVNRMLEISTVAQLGFHGHFWHDPEKFEDAGFDIRKNNTNYNYTIFYKQFEEQINWFCENNVSHNNTYSGGWWFINKDVIELLLKHNVNYDYTISKSPNLWNPFTQALVKQNNIKYGESFYTSMNNKKLLHIQNLHSGHDTAFPKDSIRFMNTIIDKDYSDIIGVLNSHDYCLDYKNTINWISYLNKLPNVKFLDHNDLIEASKIKASKTIQL